MTAAETPSLSIVIPTYNRVQRLRRVLAALRGQTVPHDLFQIIVVSDGSTDGTDDYLASTTVPVKVTSASQANQGPAAARNAGVSLASSDLILFLDDDVVPRADLVARHLQAHEEHGPNIVVLGPMLTPPDHDMSPWVRYEQTMLYKQYAAMTRGDWEPTARQFYTGNASVRREHLDRAGGFRTDLRRAEDVELAYRLSDLGLRFVFVPEAAGLHYAERGFNSWKETAYSYGRNDVRFARNMGQDWLLDVVRAELHTRRAALRLLLRLCVDRAPLSRAVLSACRPMASAGHPTASRLSGAALSVIYNVKYYQGFVDEAGSRDAVFGAGPTRSPSVARKT